MKRTLLMLLLGCVASMYANAQGFQTSGAELLDANGNPFVMKGINVPLAWFTNQTLDNIENIRENTNANCLRIVIGNGYTPNDGTGSNWNTRDEDWQLAVERCIENNMIPMVEVHNVLGSNDPEDLQAVAEWWASKADFLTRPENERYLLINIVNEWGDWWMSSPNNDPPQSLWRDAYIDAVQTIRDAGVTTTLVIDAPGYGQDYQSSTLLNYAPEVIEADPENNLMFSLHMYCEWSTTGNSDIATLLPAVKNAGIPITVGEFGFQHDEPGGICDIDEELILSIGEQHGIGWLAWSWIGNGSPLEYLDLSNNWSGTDLTPWGETIVNGTYGTQTAETATVFLSDGDNEPPVVSLIAPENEASFPHGEDIILSAEASDPDGEVANVRFFNGNVLLGIVDSEPYTFTWENAPEGEHTITARATDDGGAFTTSDPIVITVRTPCPQPDLGTQLVTCPGNVLELDSGVELNDDFEFGWSFNGQEISGASSNTLEIDEPGMYRVTISTIDCEATDEVEVVSGLLEATGDTLCIAGEATISVSGGNGPYEWFAEETGGEALYEGESYQLQVEETTVFYVEDLGAEPHLAEYIMGEIERPAGVEQWGLSGTDFADDDKNIAFIVYEELTLNAIHVYSATANNEVTIRVLEGTNVIEEVIHTVGTGKQRIPLNVSLTPGEYTIDPVGTSGTLQYQAEGASFPYELPNIMSFTGTQEWVLSDGRYGFFYEWEISVESDLVCGRTPITVVVDPDHESCTDCHGTENGTAEIDECDVCAGGETGIEPGYTCAEPEIESISEDIEVEEGEELTLTVTASGPGELSYQWFRNGQAIEGATGATYTVTEAAVSDAGTYHVVVSNENGDTQSASVEVTIIQGIDCNGDEGGTAYIDDCDVCAGGNTGIEPGFTCAEPTVEVVSSDINVEEGEDFTLEVSVSGPGENTYQWFKDGEPIEGATESTYTVPSASGSDAGSYHVVVTNDNGSTTSDPIQVSIAAAPEVDCNGDENGTAEIDECDVCAGGNTGIEPGFTCAAPTVEVVSSDINVEEGEDFTLEVSVSGPGENTYQWFKDGEPIEGATESTYTVPSASVADAGSYYVVVTNDNGSVTSDEIHVNVSLAVDCNGVAGGTAEIDECGECAGGDTGIEPGSSCPVENPEIVSIPTELEATLGELFELNINATGPGSFTYRWYHNGNPIDGATSSSYTVDETSEEDAGTYYVVITSSNGGETRSDNITLTVTEPVDCNGDAWGDAFIDVCGECAGGNTDREPIEDEDECITSINAEDVNGQVKVYPNPANTELFVEHGFTNTVNITVYNNHGQAVVSIENSLSTERVNVNDLPAGMYHITIQGNDSIKHISFIKH
ncbi:immunoglobulin domain-containing protein [Cytophagaceae bacterium ABcell3]|nr:immunoglobulin domain-containing protein [Cytophagaceae bacterium ABcell3]